VPKITRFGFLAGTVSRGNGLRRSVRAGHSCMVNNREGLLFDLLAGNQVAVSRRWSYGDLTLRI